MGLKSNNYYLIVSVADQKMHLLQNDKVVRTFVISTSYKGVGSIENSNRTPLGTHRIAEKHGDNAEIGETFWGVAKTGKKVEIYTDETDTSIDYVTTRVLWLEGMEPGKNKGGDVDSYKRKIFIHGTNEEGLLGKPASHGCIRMKNTEVIELFNLIPVNTFIEIIEESYQQ